MAYLPKTTLPKYCLLFVFSLITSDFLTLTTPAYARSRCAEGVFGQELGKRSYKELRKLKIATYNFERIYDHFEGKVPADKRAGKAKAILALDPDIFVGTEADSPERFNKEYLRDRYEVLRPTEKPMSDMDVVVFVKRDLSFIYQIEHHAEEMWKPDGKDAVLFPRNLISVIIRRADLGPRARPEAILLGHHGKSLRRDPGEPDPMLKITAQIERIAEIVDRYNDRFGYDVPIAVGGDFNIDLKSDIFAPYWNVGLGNSADLGDRPLTDLARVTHTFHPRRAQAEWRQLDSILISVPWWRAVDRGVVYRYVDEKTRKQRPLPNSGKERDKNPSDHFPYMLILDLQAGGQPILQ